MMKIAAALCLVLTGCGTVKLVRAPEVDEAACTASCNAHYDQCPKVFAGFPDRAAVECPAEHNNCLWACANGRPATRAAAAPAVMSPPAATVVMSPPAAAGHPTAVASANSGYAVSSKEARLRELKHFYDEGLVSEDVYRDRQKEILAEP